MARTILDIDPANAPERARKAVDSHLKRARADRDALLQLLGIPVVPPDGRAGR